MKVLVIGKSTRSIVCSARRAGYTVFALDHFGDIDMQECADRNGILKSIDKKDIYEMARTFDFYDAAVLMPGFEKLKFKKVLNNKTSVQEEINDKLNMAKKLDSMGIPHPRTASIKNAQSLEFPIMIKPRTGSGGMRNVLARNEVDLEFITERIGADEFIAQEFIEGIPCSASLIGTGDDAVVIGLNEQLIGLPWLTALPFAYCGNITPFISMANDEMISCAEDIAKEFKLQGSNGVDFITTEKGPVVIEINPRFQGSLDSIELSNGMNVFDAHVRSFEGKLPELRDPFCFAGKAILYADKKIHVDKRLSDKLVEYMEKGKAADIPRTGCVVQPDEPITTFLETGASREMILENIHISSNFIRGMTEA